LPNFAWKKKNRERPQNLRNERKEGKEEERNKREANKMGWFGSKGRACKGIVSSNKIDALSEKI